MRPEYLGNSYDIVKREIIHGLAPAEEWATHPMYLDPNQVAGFVDRYAEFLGVGLVAGDIDNRDEVLAVGQHCPQHLLLDPDVGLRTQPNPPEGGNWDRHIMVDELAEIASACGREHTLTLVFDQGYSRTFDDGRRRQGALQKLQALRHAHGEHEVHSVAYVTHVVFIWVSTNEDLLARATQQLLDRSRLPRSRFIDDGCGRNHIRA